MGGERDQGETEVGERQGETELGRWETETKRERDKRGHTHREKQTGKTEAERVLASGRDGEGEGEGVSAAETEVSLGSGGVRAIREGHSGLGSPAGAGPAGYRRGPSLPPPSPPRRLRRRPSSELPSYRRIRKLLTGEAAANQRAASLFSGRRPGDAPSPDTQRSTRPHSHSGSHTYPVPGTRSIACPLYAHNHRDTHRVIHTRPQEHAETHSIADAQNLRDTLAVPGHTALPRSTITMTHNITLTHSTLKPSVAQTHAFFTT